MGGANTLLTLLRSRTYVDCDTLDAAVAESLGPFEDGTSNQALAFTEFSQHQHKELLVQATSLAKDVSSTYTNVTTTALAVEIGVRAPSLPYFDIFADDDF